jgi:hypothetical protein
MFGQVITRRGFTVTTATRFLGVRQLFSMQFYDQLFVRLTRGFDLFLMSYPLPTFEFRAAQRVS